MLCIVVSLLHHQRFHGIYFVGVVFCSLRARTDRVRGTQADKLLPVVACEETLRSHTIGNTRKGPFGAQQKAEVAWEFHNLHGQRQSWQLHTDREHRFCSTRRGPSSLWSQPREHRTHRGWCAVTLFNFASRVGSVAIWQISKYWSLCFSGKLLANTEARRRNFASASVRTRTRVISLWCSDVLVRSRVGFRETNGLRVLISIWKFQRWLDGILRLWTAFLCNIGDESY